MPGSASGSERLLSFEDRLACQEAIERVYYSHQIGATRSFEDAVPREVLERKVRTSLVQSVALEQRWRTPVTAESLERELERIAGNTRLPERLLEVYGALRNDSVLIQECLARPVLVDRLARSFFSRDERIHSRARREAEELRARLARGGLDPRAEDPRRSEVEIVREDPNGARNQAPLDPRNAPGMKDRRLVLSPLKFDEWRHRAPEEVGQIGEVVEERERFVVFVVLEEGSGWARLARYVVSKQSWDHWWRSTSVHLDSGRAVAVALSLVRLPDPVGRTGSEPVDDQHLPFEPWSAGDSGPPCAAREAWNNGVLDDPIAYRARAGHTAVWTGSVMVAWGGFDGGSYTNLGGRYDPLTDAWNPTTTANAPTGRFKHTAVWTGSLMIVWGGWAGPFQQNVNTGGRYDPVSDTWTPTTTVNAPQDRELHTAVWTGSRMVVWGGGAGGASFNTGGRYDPATDTWKATKIVNAPAGRTHHTAVWTGSLMVVWGGGNFTGALDTGGRYNPVTDAWAPTTTVNAPEERSLHTAVWTGGVMVIWGGGTVSFFNTGGRYDPLNDTWTQTATLNAPEGRVGHKAVWTGREMVLWAGKSEQTRLDTGGRYDPVSDSWTPTATDNAPEAREDHTAVWTGSLMVAWGGSGGGSYLNTGGRYDPVADSWTPTSTGTAPEARVGNTTVWTGTVMVIWGGGTYGPVFFNTGSRYDPLTDSWSPTSIVDAPEARGGRTAVWTGSVMVVWGGADDVGGRYDPIADTWAPTTPVNAPTARSAHTAVWTGSLMVVWGGLSGDEVKTGGRYDPVADAWTATSTVNAPTERYGHTAVWTGSVMVIWGGLRGGGKFAQFFNTGGRYDPVSDTWSPTSTVSAPEARADHTAVWSGSRMVVWGGRADNFGTELNTGGRYDPGADAWMPTTVLNAPQARRDHTAVWTGTRVIVWGGADHSFNLTFNTGGRYDPATDTWKATTTANAPEGRENHTAVWAGSAMLVWGGWVEGAYLDTGGRYGLFPTCASWWRAAAKN